MDSSVQETAEYDALVQLYEEFRGFQHPDVTDGVPDYTPSAMEAQAEELSLYQQRLDAIDTSDWSISERVDYEIVAAEMNAHQFEHEVLRPWERDPAWYVIVRFQFGPKIETAMGLPDLPLDDDDEIAELETKLRAVPDILEQARVNLTDGASDLNMLGQRTKEREEELLEDFITELEDHHPELVSDATTAREAVESFREWLEANEDEMTAAAGIGIENYNWFLQNVLLLPYTWSDLLALSKREHERAISTIAIEEHGNRDLPAWDLVDSEQAFIDRHTDAQQEIIEFLEENEIPVPDTVEVDPPSGWSGADERDYFQHVLDRDPAALIPHEFIGHGPDAARRERDDRPIRGQRRLFFTDSTRAEALATGIERVLLHLGLLDDRPRSRELSHNLLGFRAARSISDLKMHSNEFTLEEAFQFNVDETPRRWLPEDSPTMWHDIELYLRQPAYGVGYLIGNIQLQRLIADRRRQQGTDFDLGTFMENFVEAGMIPLTLIHWELTGEREYLNEVTERFERS